METVGDVMESIHDLKKLFEFIDSKVAEAINAGKEHEADAFDDVSLALRDYITVLKRMKLKEEF